MQFLDLDVIISPSDEEKTPQIRVPCPSQFQLIISPVEAIGGIVLTRYRVKQTYEPAMVQGIGV